MAALGEAASSATPEGRATDELDFGVADAAGVPMESAMTTIVTRRPRIGHSFHSFRHTPAWLGHGRFGARLPAQIELPAFSITGLYHPVRLGGAIQTPLARRSSFTRAMCVRASSPLRKPVDLARQSLEHRMVPRTHRDCLTVGITA